MKGTPRSLNSSSPNGELVTISPIRIKRFFGASIRWKILLAFFVIVGLSFGVAATNMSGVVRDYLLEQRTREDSLLTEQAAVAVAPFFASASPEGISIMLEENAGNMDGRLMLIDQDGKVQYDTLREMSGCRVQIDEVRRVLTGMAEQAYGIPSQGGAEAARLGGSDYSGQIAYSVHAMDAEDGQVGALLFVSRIQSVIDSLNSVQWQLYSVFILIAVAALVLAEDGKGRPERPRAGTRQRRAARTGGELQYHGGAAGTPGQDQEPVCLQCQP